MKEDIDILVIGTEQEVNYTLIPEVETKVRHELQVTVILYHEWENRTKIGEPFIQSVLAKHILIEGAEL